MDTRSIFRDRLVAMNIGGRIASRLLSRWVESDYSRWGSEMVPRKARWELPVARTVNRHR